MGATLNFNAGREQSPFTVSGMKGGLNQGIDILADFVTKVPAANLAKESEIISRNLGEKEVPTRAVVEDRLSICAFRDYDLGCPSVGPREGIAGLTENHQKHLVDRYFTGRNMVVATTGRVAHAEVVQFAAAALGGVAAGAPKLAMDKPCLCCPELLYQIAEMDPTAYTAAGWERVPWRDLDAVTFMLMEHIIGSCKKGEGRMPRTISGDRVINAVANKMQVDCADEFEVFYHFYRDAGIFGYCTACEEVAVEHAVCELKSGANMLSFSVTDEEVVRAKRELKHKLSSCFTGLAG